MLSVATTPFQIVWETKGTPSASRAQSAVSEPGRLPYDAVHSATSFSVFTEAVMIKFYKNSLKNVFAFENLRDIYISFISACHRGLSV